MSVCVGENNFFFFPVRMSTLVDCDGEAYRNSSTMSISIGFTVDEFPQAMRDQKAKTLLQGIESSQLVVGRH